MTLRETNRATVARLMSILAGETPIEAGAEIIVPDVVAHVDRWTFRGIEVWAKWIHYIRTRPHLTDPTLAVDGLDVHRDSTVTARARWRALRAGRPIISDPGMARYRLVDGRIVEIWSTRHNYAFLCGAHVHSHWGFALELLRVRRWSRGEKRMDLRDRASLAVRSPRAEPALAPLIRDLGEGLSSRGGTTRDLHFAVLDRSADPSQAQDDKRDVSTRISYERPRGVTRCGPALGSKST